MNTREALQAIFDFRTDTKIPRWEFGYWHDTILRWYKEGLPRVAPPALKDHVQFLAGDVCAWTDCLDGQTPPDHDVHSYFNLSPSIRSVPLNMGPFPAFERIVLADDEEYITFQRWDGKTVKTRKDGGSMPHFLRYPVSDRDDFAEIRPRFAPLLTGRLAAPLPRLAEAYKDRIFPLQLGGSNFCGFYSILREMMGVEETSYLLYDDPDLAEKMLDFFTDYYIELYSHLLASVDVDYILIWEDMCYNHGPLISPAMFREFCAPRYKRLITAMRALGIKHFIVDTDGDCEALIEDFLGVGVTGIYPFEIAAGMDVEQIRNRYPQLVIIGGIDKRALAQGTDAIDEQVKKAERLLQKGGYLPCADHAIAPDVSFANYCYYRRRMNEILG